MIEPEWSDHAEWFESQVGVHPESPIDSYGDLRWDEEGRPATWQQTAYALTVPMGALTLFTLLFVLGAIAVIRWLS